MTDENTSIQIKQSTKTKLNEFGRKGESYNDIIERLLDE